jgi:hypothetical protein
MHRRNHRILTLICLSFFLLFTGCVQADIHVDIHRDGSGTYQVKVLTNDLILPNLGNVKARLKQQGFQLREISEGSQKGFVAEKKVRSVIKEPPGKTFESLKPTGSAPATGPKKDGGLNVEHQFFTSRIIYQDVINLSEEMPRQDLAEWILKQMNFRFHLTTPLQAEEHNATSVEQGGKTLTWKIDPTKPNPVYVVYVIPNPYTWSVILLLAVIGLAAGIIWGIRVRRRKKRTGDSTEPPVSFRWDSRK